MAKDIEKREMPKAGNFPVDQYMIDEFDPVSGELKFTKRISMQDRYLTPGGAEIPDPRPAAPALGRKPEMNIRDYIKTLVHNERLQAEIDAAGHETFEEANDFEVGDDYFPDSQYENDLEPSVAELVREGTASLSAKARAAEKREHDEKMARRAARRAELDEGESTLHSPEKSPRRARRGPAVEPEGSTNGDQSGDD